mmetsp:Transcript_81143/g.225801  ORF Transcript_81143/g.225801 Transcript_81143/m.225801 type:complete len:478 (+) Transcript_81143:99-1532(+)
MLEAEEVNEPETTALPVVAASCVPQPSQPAPAAQPSQPAQVVQPPQTAHAARPPQFAQAAQLPQAAQPAQAEPQPTVAVAAAPQPEAAVVTAPSCHAAPEVLAEEAVAKAQEDAPPEVAAEASDAAPGAGDTTVSPDDSDAGAQGETPDRGVLGKIGGRVSAVAGRVGELQTVQRGVQAARSVAESEKVQQSVSYVRQKTAELAESERVQKVTLAAKNLSSSAQATAAIASVAGHAGYVVAKEKAALGIEYAKDKTRGLREGAGTVWEKGRGSISRIRANVSGMQWRGSARETLDMAAREEQWKNIKVQGAEELGVPARTEHTSCYHVKKGSTLRWTFRVKDHDIGFGVRMRVQEWGGSREDEVLAVERYDSADTVSGSWVADENRTIVLVFDNKYSRLRGKTVAYFVGTEASPVVMEPPPDDGSGVVQEVETSATATSAAAASAAEAYTVEAPAAVAPEPEAAAPVAGSAAPRAIV